MSLADHDPGRRHSLQRADDRGALYADRFRNFSRRLTVSLPEAFKDEVLACVNAMALERHLDRPLERSRDTGHHVKKGRSGLLFLPADAHRRSFTASRTPAGSDRPARRIRPRRGIPDLRPGRPGLLDGTAPQSSASAAPQRHSRRSPGVDKGEGLACSRRHAGGLRSWMDSTERYVVTMRSRALSVLVFGGLGLVSCHSGSVTQNTGGAGGTSSSASSRSSSASSSSFGSGAAARHRASSSASSSSAASSEQRGIEQQLGIGHGWGEQLGVVHEWGERRTSLGSGAPDRHDVYPGRRLRGLATATSAPPPPSSSASRPSRPSRPSRQGACKRALAACNTGHSRDVRASSA